jgi:hypothetical protein
VDAFIASMLVGRLLGDLYQPLPNVEERSLLDIFFAAQLTTAIMYDPLLPLLHKAESDPKIAGPFNRMRLEILQWFHGRQIDAATHHEEMAEKLTEYLTRNGLYNLHRNLQEA